MSDAPLLWALDVSKRCTGFAWGYAGDKPTLSSIMSSEHQSVVDASGQLRLHCFNMLTMGRPARIYVEKTLQFGFRATLGPDGAIKQRQGFDAAIMLERMVHGVELFAWERSIPITLVAPQTVRKDFLGSGKLDRKTAKKRALAMCRLLGWNAANDDEADAAGVWYFGVCQTAPNLAPAIHPGMFAKAATEAAGNTRGFDGLDREISW